MAERTANQGALPRSGSGRWFPPLSDARYLQLGILFAYAIIAREVFHLERSHWVTLGCLATAVTLDALYGKFYYHRVIAPLSAMIVAMASSLLMDSRLWWLYLVVAALGISSKALVTYKGRHIFNPGNFGVALLLLLIPDQVVGMPQLFESRLAYGASFFALGLALVLYARQAQVSLSWLSGFAAFATIRAVLKGAKLLVVLAPILSPGILLFTFHMISDPATTPRTRRMRLAFGFSVAALDAAMRLLAIPNSPIYSLFAVSMLTPWIREFETGERPVRTRLPMWIGVAIVLPVALCGWKIRHDLRLNPARDRPSALLTSGAPPAFELRDVTSDLGITYRHESPVLDLRGNTRLLFPAPGVAVADFNGDGFMDILLLSSKPEGRIHLYLNRGGKDFVDSAEQWGVASIGKGLAPTTALAFDYDNDGRPDLFFTGMGCTKLFHNLGGRFERVSAAAGLEDCENTVAAVPIDYDGDGLIDLYLVKDWPAYDYFKLDTHFPYPTTFADPHGGGTNVLERNTGHGFVARPSDGGSDDRWSLDAAAGDLAGDGKTKLYVANDWGQDTLWNLENGKLVSNPMVPIERRNGMNVSLGDLTHDGVPSIYVSNIYGVEYFPHGNFLWRFPPSGWPTEHAQEAGVDRCGWAWGAAFADFDLNGEPDLYIANGFVTGKSKLPYNEYAYQASTNALVPSELRTSVNRGWPLIGDRSYQGGQIGCFMLNRGEGRFDNVAAQVGIRTSWDGRAVAPIDFDNDGGMDLLVTEDDGPAHLFKNTIEPKSHWIGFSLVGTRSNRDAVGARVEIESQGKHQYRWAQGGRTGYLATSDPRLHFGLPLAKPVTARVRWPDGRVQDLGQLEPGRYHVVTEPR